MYIQRYCPSSIFLRHYIFPYCRRKIYAKYHNSKSCQVLTQLNSEDYLFGPSILCTYLHFPFANKSSCSVQVHLPLMSVCLSLWYWEDTMVSFMATTVTLFLIKCFLYLLRWMSIW